MPRSARSSRSIPARWRAGRSPRAGSPALGRRVGAGVRHGPDRRRLRTRGTHRLALRRDRGLAAGGPGRQHAASDRLEPGVGRLSRPALAHRARHLQFHRRRRQGGAARRVRADRRVARLAAGDDRDRRDRDRRRRRSSSRPAAGRDARKGDERQGRRGRGPTVGLLAAVLHPRRRRPGAHRLPDLPAVPAARQGRRPADHRPRPVAAVRRRRRGQAGDGLGRRALRRRVLGDLDRGGDDRADPRARCRCRSRPRWCCCRSSA